MYNTRDSWGSELRVSATAMVADTCGFDASGLATEKRQVTRGRCAREGGCPLIEIRFSKDEDSGLKRALIERRLVVPFSFQKAYFVHERRTPARCGSHITTLS